MRKQDLLGQCHDIFSTCLDILDRKNSDYSDQSDTLGNLKIFGFHGVVVRLSDKLMRLINLTKKGFAVVSDETMKDTLHDIINYAALALVLMNLEIGFQPGQIVTFDSKKKLEEFVANCRKFHGEKKEKV
jgi:hypothetical protein